jgi:uncharacterized protein
MAKILDEILKELPKNVISDSVFEGANIILYTKDKDFFLNRGDMIRNIVSKIKKRVELRPDPSITVDMEKAEKFIKKSIPEEAGVANILFDPQRSVVVIEAAKPGIAIGKQGEVLKDIKQKTFWVPNVQRTAALKSQIIENIRSVLYQNNDYRKKFLNKVGQRIYNGPIKEKKEEWIRVTFFGGGRQVGRSCVFLQTPESKILLDCGVNVAFEDYNAYPLLDCPEFKIEELDAIIITHSHIDHSGFVPFLYKMGYKGPTYWTAPTQDVAALLALDFVGVAFKQAKKALFDVSDVKEMVKHSIVLGWEEVTDITPDMRLTLYNSGHILGSSMAHLHIGNGAHNLVYTGDMKYLRTQLLDPAVTNFPRLETIIIESTYGSRNDILGSRKEAERKLIQKINETVKRGGKVLFPVLGSGRAQEVMLVLEKAVREGLIDKVPIYVQGMVWDITAIHTAYPDFLNRDLRKSIFHHDINPFLSPIFNKVASRKEQEKIIDDEGPCVILATAGMLNAGASLEYFKQLANNPKNSIVFTCYLGEGTIGRKVQNGEKTVSIAGYPKPEVIHVNMEITTITDFTSHAGRNELMRFVHNLNPRPKRIIINHGEASKCLDLASSIHKTIRVETNAPKNLDTIRLK